MNNKNEIAVFGGGCFWCTEAVFNELRGVVSVMPGYAGGPSTSSGQATPTYDQVSMGNTGHAEVTRVEFDPAQITYKDLLTVFFATHDSTTLNRQGNDRGTEYRSIILYTNENQKQEAESFIKEISGAVTEVKPFGTFYEAEEEHKQYYQSNSQNMYCQIVINPKLEKVQKQFANLLGSHGK